LLDRLKRGLHFAEGRFRADDVRFVKRKSGGAILDITLSEGQNREVRRMLARIGHKVLRLERVALGPLILGDIPPGVFRPLSQRELQALLAAVSRAEKEAKSGSSKPKRLGRRGSSRGKDARSPNSAARQTGRKPSPVEKPENPDLRKRAEKKRAEKPFGRPMSRRTPGPIVEVDDDAAIHGEEAQPVHPRFRRGGGGRSGRGDRRPPRTGASEVFDE
jgi:23S rRNA pseudouridine2605 synthase